MNLTRLKSSAPDFKMMEEELQSLMHFLDQPVNTTDEEWLKSFSSIINFQDNDGSFKLLDSFQIESDCRVRFCYLPTYICSAILIKAFLFSKDILSGKEDCILRSALRICCSRGLKGQGYDDISGQIEALEIFIKADVKTFIIKYPELCPEFTEMILSISQCYSELIEKQSFVFGFGESYEEKIRSIGSNLHFDLIFVYGTLLKGQRNYIPILSPASPLCTGEISGFEMYDLGDYPGIVNGTGSVKGEIFEISPTQALRISALECEGLLYLKEKVKVKTPYGNQLNANVYVYNKSVSGKRHIPYEKQPYNGRTQYVWYVSYGSNMMEERFLSYITGGISRFNNRNYEGCSNQSKPIKSIQVELPFNMYYANNSLSWNGGPVCFLDTTKRGISLGRAWLIEKSQLEDIHRQEGSSQNWYPDVIELDSIDGIKAYTFTNNQKKPSYEFGAVSANYGYVLYKGIKETYPTMTDDEIYIYLKNCGNNK